MKYRETEFANTFDEGFITVTEGCSDYFLEFSSRLETASHRLDQAYQFEMIMLEVWLEINSGCISVLLLGLRVSRATRGHSSYRVAILRPP